MFAASGLKVGTLLSCDQASFLLSTYPHNRTSYFTLEDLILRYAKG